MPEHGHVVVATAATVAAPPAPTPAPVPSPVAVVAVAATTQPPSAARVPEPVRVPGSADSAAAVVDAPPVSPNSPFPTQCDDDSHAQPHSCTTSPQHPSHARVPRPAVGHGGPLRS